MSSTHIETDLPDLAAVRAAAERIAPHVHRTPVLRSATLDAELGAEIFCKAENLQKIGAFKARGATNAVLSLSEEEAACGVLTHSSGNHGAAVAYAAAKRGVPAVVVMPDAANPIKIAAVRGYGAEVVLCPRAERERTAARLQAERGLTFLHPFDDARIIAGQGTAALELLDEVGALDVVVAPVGGGGLLAGTALVVRSLLPGSHVVGAEPEAVDDAARSMATGVLQPTVEGARTWADGLMTGLGERNFELLQRHDVEIVTVSEAAMLAGALFHLQRMKTVVEPSCGTVLAAARALGERIRGKRVGLVLSGGNTDFSWVAEALANAGVR